jgi:hypothetical protein
MPELQQRKNPLRLPPPNCLQEDGFAALVQHKGRYVARRMPNFSSVT